MSSMQNVHLFPKKFSSDKERDDYVFDWLRMLVTSTLKYSVSSLLVETEERGIQLSTEQKNQDAQEHRQNLHDFMDKEMHEIAKCVGLEYYEVVYRLESVRGIGHMYLTKKIDSSRRA